MTKTTRTDLTRRIVRLEAEVEFCADRDRARAILTELVTIQTLLA
jgi:hypothetical protein